jgi:hypothetical protein
VTRYLRRARRASRPVQRLAPAIERSSVPLAVKLGRRERKIAGGDA